MGGIFSGIGELFLPRSCAVCGEGGSPRPEEGGPSSRLCAPCGASLAPLPASICTVCSLPFGGAGPSHPCPSCRKRPPPFAKAVAWGIFGGTLKRAIHLVKYRKDLALRGVLLDLFAETAKREFGGARGFSAVVPVPCHPEGLSGRGFDLPALLARRAAKELSSPWAPGALVKTRPGVRLAGLGLRERRSAVRGLYDAGERVSGRVLLVDDVLTSLSTARACSKKLLSAGAEEVYVAALARAEVDPAKNR